MDQCPAPADGLSTLLGSIDIGDIDLDPALQLDATGDEFVEWLESFQDDVPLPIDNALTQAREAGSTESSHMPSLSSQAGSGSVDDDKPARRQGRSSATAAQKVDRLEKVREKNRCVHSPSMSCPNCKGCGKAGDVYLHRQSASARVKAGPVVAGIVNYHHLRVESNISEISLHVNVACWKFGGNPVCVHAVM